MIAKTAKDIENLREGGKLLARALKETAALVFPGQTTAALDLAAEKYIREGGGIPSFLGYKPAGARIPYPAVLCVSINEEVVHGIPSEKRTIKEGDIISLDLGLSYNGLFVDSALTMCVGEGDANAKKLIAATNESISTAIKAIHIGGHIGDIGAAVVEVAERHRFSIVQDLGGHGVGKAVHEHPFIANEGRIGEGEPILDGMVLAIEPMFAEGQGRVVLAPDGWTYSMRDGLRAAHFEHTVFITETGAKVLTERA